ncbi:MAG: four helix bundle protein [Patescibacteria group bacterium]|jgi:four helix bundle protein
MIQKSNAIAEKSYQFALRIVKLYQFLIHEKKEFTLGKQILRSGTSIGANVAEATGSQSKKEFRAKMSTAYKEVCETIFWLKLLRDSDYIPADLAESFLADCEELAKISGKILATTTKALNH